MWMNVQGKAKAETIGRAKMSSRQEQGKAKAETIGRAKMNSRQEQGKARTANISGNKIMESQLKPEHLEQRETQEQLEQEERTRSSRSSFFWPQWAPVTVTTESTGGDAREITANNVSMLMLSLSIQTCTTASFTMPQ